MPPMDGCDKGYSQREKGRVRLIFYLDEEKVGGCYCSHMDGNAVQNMLVVSHIVQVILINIKIYKEIIRLIIFLKIILHQLRLIKLSK